jgi:transcription termination/antitermination protein NusG
MLDDNDPDKNDAAESEERVPTEESSEQAVGDDLRGAGGVGPPVATSGQPTETPAAEDASPDAATEDEAPVDQAPMPEAPAGEPQPAPEDEDAEAEAPPQPAEEAAMQVTTEEEAAEEPAPADEEPALVDEAPAPAVAAPQGDGEVPAEEAEAAVPGSDPFGGPGDWYVIHTYAGYENKVKTNLESRIHTMQMEEKIFDVVIPMEDVMEIKGGKKQVVQKKVFPGYLLVKMVYDDDSWYVVRNTPGVTGFVSSGTGQKPTPLSRREVEKILTVKEEEAKKPAFRLDFEEGDVVRIISGPFADFNGTISDINVDQSKVRVMVNIFDRETPVELSFDQVARV